MPRRPTIRKMIRRSAAIALFVCIAALHAAPPGPAQPGPENPNNPGQITNETPEPSQPSVNAPGQQDAAPNESEDSDRGIHDGPGAETTIEGQPIQLKSTSFPSLWAYFTGEFQEVLEATGWSALLILSLLLVIWLISFLFQKIYSRLEGLASRLTTGLRIRNAEIMRASTMQTLLRGILRLLHLVLTAALIWFVADAVIRLFPGSADSSVASVIRAWVKVFVATIVFKFVIRGILRSSSLLERAIPGLQNRFVPNLEFQNTVLLSRQRLLGLFVGIVRGLRVLLLVLVSFIYLATVFGLFQATQNWANALLGYIYRPVSFAAGALVGYLPNLFFIILVIVATRYIIKFTGFLFREIERGTIEIPGFYDDWARPTHKILAVILIAFAAVIAFPYLPGASSDAFKGISLFLGFMLSLGSSGIIANIMAGVVITYMRPFRAGDRVKIGETEGEILEKTLLVTRIRTVKNVEITIPNGAVLSSHIINYSTTVAREDTEGLILHSTVTIGYDIPHAKVQKLLINAAKSLEFVKKSPEPFVLQTSLEDYYVSYQINCYTDRPDQMARIYSNLHEKILEQFNKAGIEIMSPHYYALRDGSSTALPEDSPGSAPSAGFPLRWRKEK